MKNHVIWWRFQEFCLGVLLRNLNLINKVGDVEYFNGYPIIYLDDTDIHDASNTHIFYVANLKELVKFFDRKGIIIEKSKEFLFNKNQD